MVSDPDSMTILLSDTFWIEQNVLLDLSATVLHEPFFSSFAFRVRKLLRFLWNLGERGGTDSLVFFLRLFLKLISSIPFSEIGVWPT